MKHLNLVVGVLMLCLAAAGGQVPQIITFEGTVAVGGTNFQGSAQFKFSLVNADGTMTYWSNDGSAAGGAEPQKAVPLPVVDGAYQAQLGDTQEGMISIPVAAFENSDVRVRVWFSDGTHGFQQLSPDTRITSVGYAMMAASVADGAITAAKIAPNAVTANSLAPGAIGPDQLAPGAAAANLQASGGLVLSDQSTATNLIQAGFQKIGSVTVDGDQWQSVSRFVPAARTFHVAVWTGQEMIIWAGNVSGATANTGGRYNPLKDVWAPISNSNLLPSASWTGIWAGTEMIVLGDRDLQRTGPSTRPARIPGGTYRWRMAQQMSWPRPLSGPEAN